MDQQSFISEGVSIISYLNRASEDKSTCYCLAQNILVVEGGTGFFGLVDVILGTKGSLKKGALGKPEME